MQCSTSTIRCTWRKTEEKPKVKEFWAMKPYVQFKASKTVSRENSGKLELLPVTALRNNEDG